MRPAVVRLVESSGPTGNGKPTCSKGHELTPGNVYNPPGTNYRRCLTCNREWLEARKPSQRVVVPPIDPLTGVNGHLFDEANTYHRPGTGHRACITCKNENRRRRRAREKEAA